MKRDINWGDGRTRRRLEACRRDAVASGWFNGRDLLKIGWVLWSITPKFRKNAPKTTNLFERGTLRAADAPRALLWHGVGCWLRFGGGG